MKAIVLPKVNPTGRLAICIGLIFVAIFLWFNAVIIGIVLLAMIPALLNTLSILPVRAVVIFLLYFISVCAWMAAGILVLTLASHIRKSALLESRYIAELIVTLVLIGVCHLLLMSNFTLYITI